MLNLVGLDERMRRWRGGEVERWGGAWIKEDLRLGRD